MKESKFKRKCCGCNKLKSKEDLIKVTIQKSTQKVVVNPDSSFMGRSVYVCKNYDCLEKAFKKGRFFKVLKCHQDDTLKEQIFAILSE